MKAAGSRITSYNVCYTKLLRLRFPEVLVMSPSAAKFRITSYNVCYTKLLRPDLLSGGIYTFSIYVKQEEPADVTPATERYPAESLTLGINPPPSAAYPANPSYSGRTVDISGVTDSTWVKVSVRNNFV